MELRVTTSISYGENNKLKMLKEIHFPNSIGLLYASITDFLGFKELVNIKLCLAHGKPIYIELFYEHLINVNSDGSFELNMKYFDFRILP